MKSDKAKSRVAPTPKDRAGGAVAPSYAPGAGPNCSSPQTSGAPAAGASSSAVPGPSSNAQAESILRAIQNVNRTRKSEEPRQAVRHHYCVPMTLHIDDPRARTTRTIRAASSNISTGGFAFIFDAALTPGSTIRAQFDSLPGKPEIEGLVRSCVHICGTQHRIGVEYQ